MDISMHPARSPAKSQPINTELNIQTAAQLLQQETSKSQPIPLKTGVKSIDSQFSDLFRTGSVIGIGQSGDDDSFVSLEITLLSSHLFSNT